ncbi:MAG: WecB/TagA/CpsF family glycosyltransferase, partial [Sphingomonas sp.]
VSIGGFHIANCNRYDLTDEIGQRLTRRDRTILFFANQNFIVQCQPLGPQIAARDDVFVVCDGIGAELAARMVNGHGFVENLNGTDFTPFLFETLGRRLRIFLVGGTPENVTAAAQVFSQNWSTQVVGVQDGYSLWDDEEAVVERIRAARPDVLIVGMGNPLQERWILANADRLEVPLTMAVGALFEWLTGAKHRAPKWVRNMRMEWVHRLASEPRRLAKRYSVGIVQFFMLVAAWGQNSFAPADLQTSMLSTA